MSEKCKFSSYLFKYAAIQKSVCVDCFFQLLCGRAAKGITKAHFAWSVDWTTSEKSVWERSEQHTTNGDHAIRNQSTQSVSADA